MADIPKKSILGIIWHLGWFGMGQNTPTGCGNNLPMLLTSHCFLLKMCISGILYVFDVIFGNFTFLYVFDEMLEAK